MLLELGRVLLAEATMHVQVGLGCMVALHRLGRVFCWFEPEAVVFAWLTSTCR